MKKLILEREKSNKVAYSTVSRYTPGCKCQLEFLIHAFNEIELYQIMQVAGKFLSGACMNDYDIYWLDGNVHIAYASSESLLKNEEVEEYDLILTAENFKKVAHDWKDVCQNEPPFLVITQDEDGWVNLVGKQELSAEDLQEVEKEKKGREEYIKAFHES